MMTIPEAAKLVGKSTKTITRWIEAGLDISDRAALLKHSDVMDCKARGSSKSRVRSRLDSVAQDIDHAILSSEYRESIAGSHSEAFVDLPAPFSGEQAMSAVVALASLKSAFSRRLEHLKEIDHSASIDLAENDLDNIERIAKELDLTLSSFQA